LLRSVFKWLRLAVALTSLAAMTMLFVCPAVWVVR